MISALFVSALTRAQAPADQKPTVLANFREADVRAVIEDLGRLTRTNVLIDDAVQGKFTFYREKPLPADDYRAAMIAELIAVGYDVTWHDGVLRIGPRKP